MVCELWDCDGPKELSEIVFIFIKRKKKKKSEIVFLILHIKYDIRK